MTCELGYAFHGLMVVLHMFLATLVLTGMHRARLDREGAQRFDRAGKNAFIDAVKKVSETSALFRADIESRGKDLKH